MKNQNDLIVTVVTVVLALIAMAAFWFTKPQPVQPPAPEQVVVTTPQLPAGDVKFAASLPGASNTPGGGGGGGLSASTPVRGGGAPAPGGGGGGGGMQVSVTQANPTGR